MTRITKTLPQEETHALEGVEDLAKFQRRISARISEMGRVIDVLAVSGMIAGPGQERRPDDVGSVEEQIAAVSERVASFHEVITKRIDSEVTALERRFFPSEGVSSLHATSTAGLAKRVDSIEGQLEVISGGQSAGASEIPQLRDSVNGLAQQYDASFLKISSLSDGISSLEQAVDAVRAIHARSLGRMEAFDENVQNIIDLRVALRDANSKIDSFEKWLVYLERKINEHEDALRHQAQQYEEASRQQAQQHEEASRSQAQQEESLRRQLADVLGRVSNVEEELAGANRKLAILTSSSAFARAVFKRVAWRLKGSRT